MYFKNEEDAFKNLKQFRGEKEIDDFMYMGSVGDVDLYKHYITRQYLNIDNKGKLHKDRRLK